jgi:hypothetical protein
MRVGGGRWRAIVVLSAAALGLACSSTPKNTNVGRPSASESGFRVLDAVVVDRAFEARSPGGGSPMTAGSGTWYLDFEAREGEATVHYRFPVTRSQYQRYADGARVQLVLANDQLRELRPAPEPK